MRIMVLTGTLAGLLLTGCGLLTDPDYETMGIVEWLESGALVSADPADGSALDLPETVDAGEQFSVTIRTYGPDGCWATARTDVSQEGLALGLVAYDEKQQGAEYCTMEPVRLARTVTTSFSEPGTATVTLTGKRIFNSGEEAATIAIERTITVRR